MQSLVKTGRALCAWLVSLALVAALIPVAPSAAYAGETEDAAITSEEQPAETEALSDGTGVWGADVETDANESTGADTGSDSSGADADFATDDNPNNSAGSDKGYAASEDSSSDSVEDGADTEGNEGETLLEPPAATTLSSAEQTANGIRLQWEKGSGNSGYAIYRLDIDATDDAGAAETDDTEASLTSHKALNAAGYTRVKKTTSADRRQWTDGGTADNHVYLYRLYTYVLDADGTVVLSETCATATVYQVATPASVKLTRSLNKKKATISWTASARATGYQVQWSASSLFASKKSATETATSRTVASLATAKTYYARVRASVRYGGVTYYSPWIRSDAGTTATITATRVKKKNGKALELRARAGLKLYKYDTVQGSCSDGTYAYFAMNNRSTNKCRIVKMRVSNRKIVKVSKVLNIGHGNDMAWNSDTGQLVVPYTTGSNRLRVACIDPNTLTITKKTSLSVGEVLDGATSGQIGNIKKVYGISYNASRKQYVVDLDGSHNLLILDSDFDSISYVTPTVKPAQTYQNIYATDDYIITTHSAKTSGQKNLIMVYDWEGNFIKKLKAPTSYELESAYLVGNTLYLAYYHSYKGTYYTTKKVTVKSKGKKKTVTKKVKHTGVIRDDYLYKATVA